MPQTHRYGPHPEQVADLHLPPGGADGAVVLLHGGFWRERFRRDQMTPLAEDLVARGVAAWNVEYRRLDAGGGWPETADDVAAAIGFLRDELGLAPLAAVGHSAGGHLALLQAERVGRIAGQAAVSDLEEASRLGLGQGVVDRFAGQALRGASPIERAPLPVPVLLVHGGADDIVPPSLSERFAARGGDVTLRIRPGEGHFEHIDVGSGAWREVAEWVTA